MSERKINAPEEALAEPGQRAAAPHAVDAAGDQNAARAALIGVRHLKHRFFVGDPGDGSDAVFSVFSTESGVSRCA